jgi:hypothetical protein
MDWLHCGRMSTNQIAGRHQVWGEPQPRSWGLRETAAAVAVAALIAALGGAAVYAATEDNSHSFGSHQPFGPGGGMPGGPGGQHGAVGRSGSAAMEPPSLHGEFVVADGAGGYTTELTQTGAVTAISPTSITVRSEDGFSQTYVIPNAAGNSGAPFAVGDQVVVHATRNGPTAIVTTIGNPRRGAPSDDNGPSGPPPRHN